MTNLFLDGERVDKNIIVRNPTILKSELERILETRKGELILVQLTGDWSFKLSVGQYVQISSDKRGDYIYLDSPLIISLCKDGLDENKEKYRLDIDYSEDQIHFFVYKGTPSEVATVVDCRRKILYKDEEELKRWHENKRTWEKALNRGVWDEKTYYQFKLVDSYLESFGSSLVI